MTTIKDSVHDHIAVEGVAEALLDTPPVQRLRRIAQLGTVTLVYPSANHTRFEHSLGVYHLADEALGHLGIEGQKAERVRAAALLHDVGHSPYSHNVEAVIYRETGKYHDDVHDLLDRGEVARVLADHDLDHDAVADLVAGDGELGQLVSGELDVDRMDYLVRDAHHTGVPYGTIDHERLIRELRFVDGDLVLDEGNVQTAESLLLARALMNPTVYRHHVARIAKTMLRRGTERLLEATDTDPAELRRWDDSDLLVSLRRTDATAGYAHRLTERRLYKRAIWAEMTAVPDELLAMDHAEIREEERAIADAANVDADAVLLDVPGEPSMPESSSRVVVNGEVRGLGEQSTLVTALRAAQRDQWRLGVYAPEAVADRVGERAIRVLGLEPDGAMVRDARPGVHATLDEFN
ncbi:MULTISPECIES: HD domain-containing protein [Halomicrobium]|uniref:Metal dependent phosphohydrolase n=2 Tax=Halomicrobium mukohataei TaxID=57705 RepID=C7NYZ6_HALMD|nr:MULTISPECIES: HD domain-containing protein [Halomicrobium]ACV48685.1 metal dependent phosphohydrolase [Halomicrobium mukohataei DSM 12286]QCD64116.1 HD domain-containing protein [Halomicrobium mukohataei]QFR18922.1 HD domain-containing protein [Halomicrobium sp. ZPS1]